jgi:putative Holliday junction resolvase
MMNRIMGLDIGDATIGIALSDPGHKMAFPHENYRRVGAKKDIAHIIDTIIINDVINIVAGMPYNMNGTIGPQAEKTQRFILNLEKKLQHTDKINWKVEVVKWDERLSSKSAERSMLAADLSRENRKQKIDMVAGAIILQTYLDYIQNGGL